MTTTHNNAVDRIASAQPVARPAEVGQATAVEQSRALAEVQAQAYLARQFPRDLTRARRDMLDACAQQSLAERSSFSFRRGGQNVTGSSVQLARELARCWGNIQYGLVELSRDDINGSSQMIAYAWDVETNARSSSTFIVPHTRDTKDGPTKLTATRDIYENNANQGARRVREAIFSVLPVWYTEEAKTECRKTLEHGGGKPLPVRIDEMVAAYKAAGITVTQLEARVRVPKTEWGVQEVATLGVVYSSLRNGETTRDDEFPPQMAPVTADEVAAQAAQPAQTAKPAVNREQVIEEIYAAATVIGINDADVADDFAQRNGGTAITDGTAEQLQAYLGALRAEAVGSR